jgi:hypothetical protein
MIAIKTKKPPQPAAKQRCDCNNRPAPRKPNLRSAAIGTRRGSIVLHFLLAKFPIHRHKHSLILIS